MTKPPSRKTSSAKDRSAMTRRFRAYQEPIFDEHGPTPAGVGWGDPKELEFRYGRILRILDHDHARPAGVPSLLDVGCGWGGLLEYANAQGIRLRYTGIDLVEKMVAYARDRFPDADVEVGDVRDLKGGGRFDYVVANGVLTQKLDATIPEMEAFCHEMIRAAFRLCRYGMAFNMMSTRVNFMATNLYYQNPSELLAYLLREVTPRVVVDHAYSSLGSGRGKFYDFTVYVYKDR